jgi:hypothetical protein
MFNYGLLFYYEAYSEKALIWLEVATADAAIFVDTRFYVKSFRCLAMALRNLYGLLLRDVAADGLLSFIIIARCPACAAKDDCACESCCFRA